MQFLIAKNFKAFFVHPLLMRLDLNVTRWWAELNKVEGSPSQSVVKVRLLPFLVFRVCSFFCGKHTREKVKLLREMMGLNVLTNTCSGVISTLCAIVKHATSQFPDSHHQPSSAGRSHLYQGKENGFGIRKLMMFHFLKGIRKNLHGIPNNFVWGWTVLGKE